MHKWAHCRDKTANHQLPIAAAFWIIRIVFTEECSSLMQNLMQIHCSTCSVILNATATQYTCSLNSNGISCPHWLVEWSHHCSCMCIPVHSPWLPGYINVAQTILAMLTMAGLFSDRSCIPEHMLVTWPLKVGRGCVTRTRWSTWKSYLTSNSSESYTCKKIISHQSNT